MFALRRLTVVAHGVRLQRSYIKTCLTTTTSTITTTSCNAMSIENTFPFADHTSKKPEIMAMLREIVCDALSSSSSSSSKNLITRQQVNTLIMQSLTTQKSASLLDTLSL
uniref:Uncharacterized protein n=1 Tax=Lygus hesperus TaxID=30085 RepID=A0A146LUU2_LYGHE